MIIIIVMVIVIILLLLLCFLFLSAARVESLYKLQCCKDDKSAVMLVIKFKIFFLKITRRVHSENSHQNIMYQFFLCVYFSTSHLLPFNCIFMLINL